MGLALLLVIVTFWQPTNFQYQNNTDYKKLAAQNAAEQAAYQKYLDSIQSDPVASKDLFQQLVTEADVKAQVETELDVNQKVVLPNIADSSIEIAKTVSKDSAVSYFTRVAALTQDFNSKVVDTSSTLFSSDADAAQLAAIDTVTTGFISNLQKTPVPPDAVNFHKAALANFQSYQNLVKLAEGYQSQPEQSPWPQVYKNYAVINSEVGTAKQEFSQLDKKYSLSTLPPQHLAAGSGKDRSGID